MLEITRWRHIKWELTLAKGLGIALVAARAAGVPVTVVDNSQKSLDKGLAFAGMP